MEIPINVTVHNSLTDKEMLALARDAILEILKHSDQVTNVECFKKARIFLEITDEKVRNATAVADQQGPEVP